MRAILLLGGNLNNVQETLTKAVLLLSSQLGQPIRKSGYYESPPWGFEAEHSFINQVVEFNCNYEPAELLRFTQSVEKELGRQQKTGTTYESRPIDIDILFCDDLVIKTENLTIPHPLLQERRFTLLPLNEYWSDFQHPILKHTTAELLDICPDKSLVKKL